MKRFFIVFFLVSAFSAYTQTSEAAYTQLNDFIHSSISELSSKDRELRYRRGGLSIGLGILLGGIGTYFYLAEPIPDFEYLDFSNKYIGLTCSICGISLLGLGTCRLLLPSYAESALTKLTKQRDNASLSQEDLYLIGDTIFKELSYKYKAERITIGGISSALGVGMILCSSYYLGGGYLLLGCCYFLGQSGGENVYSNYKEKRDLILKYN